MEDSRELTRQEKAAIRALVVKWCANYDRDYGCLPLDCECYMLGKCWTGAYCRYFREAVLPLDPGLEASLTTPIPAPELRICPMCGRGFPPSGIVPPLVRPRQTAKRANSGCGTSGAGVTIRAEKSPCFQGVSGSVL